MKTLSALASSAALAFALSFAAAPAFAHDHGANADAKSAEITHKGGKEKACCKKKKNDERCEKGSKTDSAWAADSAQCAKMDKERCRKDSAMSNSACCKKHKKGEKKACCKKHESGEEKACCKKKDDDHCRKESAVEDSTTPVAKQAIKPAQAKK